MALWSGLTGRRQASMQKPDEVYDEFYAGDGLHLATVLAVRYPDSGKTQVKFETSYDIVFHMPRYRMDSVRVLRTRGGYADGDDHTLHPSYKSIDASKKFDHRTGNLLALDGDVVAVGFIEGDLRRPVIVGCLGHPRAEGPHVGSAAAGERRTISHKGTTVTIDKDGNLAITMAPDKNVTVQTTGTGKVVLGDGTEYSAAWAEKVQANLDKLEVAIEGHTHSGVTVGGGVTGSGTITTPIAYDGMASDKVKVRG